MTKLTIVLGLFIFSTTSFGQALTVGAKKKLLTTKYTGTYCYGVEVEKTRIGTIIIYPETDSTILFCIDLNRGAPSYNMGFDYGRVRIINDTGTYYTKEDGEDKGCKWSIQFIKNTLVIKTIDNQDNCGFGYGVYAAGTFIRTSKKLTAYFENQEGTKIYFKDV